MTPELVALLDQPTAAQLAEEASYQAELLARSRALAGPEDVPFEGRGFTVFPTVFAPNLDSAALIRSLPDLAYASFAEIGVGSGAVSVFAALRGARGVGVDINPAAVVNARLNLERHGVAGRVTVRHGDLLPLHAGPFDLLIANLPFMRAPAADVAARAIFDAELNTWRRFAHSARSWLAPGGELLTVLPNFCAHVEILTMLDQAGFRGRPAIVVREGWMNFVAIRLRPV